MKTEYIKLNVWLHHIGGSEVDPMLYVSVQIKGYYTRWLFFEEETWTKTFTNLSDVKNEIEYWNLPFTVNFIKTRSMGNDNLFDRAKAIFSGKMGELGINL